MGYDRLFLIGDMAWQDYQITAEVTVHEVAPNGTQRRQQPGGRHALLDTWSAGRAGFRSLSQSGVTNRSAAWPGYGGSAARQPLPSSCDVNEDTDYGRVEVRAGEKYVLKALCQTLPDDAEGRGVTRYAFKFWHAAAKEPPSWAWEHVQVSRDALRAVASRWSLTMSMPASATSPSCPCRRITAIIDQARLLAVRVRKSASASPRLPPAALNRTSSIEGNRLATKS